ncbi:MAG TPA: tetratricopeptide repeat protein, partial [Atribacterota bacterium]|nr:tetratricopeptide repeat protein [Atribacterota bacterium]
ETDQYQKAVETFKEAIKQTPDDADAQYALGWSYGKLQDYEQAKKSFQETIRIQPDYVYAHYGLGIAYLSLGERNLALEEYKILKELDNEIANLLFDQIYP